MAASLPYLVLVLFLGFLILIIHGVAASKIAGNETDLLSLLEIKQKFTHDPFGITNSWNNSIHFCKWQGVSCSTRHQRVTALDLSSKHLAGALSPHVGNMSFLRALILRNNTFDGEIPREIGKLFRLETLGLENNSFSGEIPANLSRCLGLQYLGLDGNRLTGKIPVQLGLLRNLEVLFLRSNSFAGELPYSLGNLSSLVALAASENSLRGSIPDSLGLLRNLIYIALGVNSLSGPIPLPVFNLSSLYHIALPVNRLEGSLPSSFGLTLPKLRLLFLHSNSLTGPLPHSIANLSDLQIISLSRNQFTGKIPSLENVHNLQGLAMHYNNLGNGEDSDMDFLSSLVNCTGFEELSLSVNNLGGRLPGNIGNFSTKFRSIGLAANKLVGTIPAGISSLTNMEVISLEYNQLTGEIPESIGKLSELKYFYVKGNELSGTIPSSLGNLTLLSGLNLAQNNLQGRIPASLGNCIFLQMLYLSGNEFAGMIPKEVLGLSSLSIQLDLSDNRLSGPLPLEVGRLINLGYLNLSWNKLSGKLPSTLGSCIRLEELYVQGNRFEGPLPSSLSSLKGLEHFDVSHNNFSGPIPTYLQGFSTFISLNLSFNQFEGEVPRKGVFRNLSAVVISGNKNLCGGLEELKLPSCGSQHQRNGGVPLGVKIAISVAGGLLGIALVSIVFIILWFSRKREVSPARDSSINSFPKMSYADLLKATNNFSVENLIGKGSFGSVYKGAFDEPDGRNIAVKVLNMENIRAYKSFIAECEVLRNLRHRNLVKLLTAYSGADYQRHDFKALVYEFMVNGSLEDWLHPTSQESRFLDFHQRLNIAMEIAFALEYLHLGSQTPVVHCDLKPSNVLLRADMSVCLGDFGLAKFLQESAQHSSSANESSSLVINGTIGYAAPEYGMGSEVSTYGDMYSYGIIILELFTGKRPTDEIFINGLDLHNYGKMALPDGIAKIVDQMLLHGTKEEDFITTSVAQEQEKKVSGKFIECLVSVFQIGVACTLESPRERMDISDVVRELYLIKANFLKW